jgi:hypothetical protein
MQAAERFNLTQVSSISAPSSDGISRAQLEQEVLSSIFAADAAYADHALEWAQAAGVIKNLAVTNPPPQAVIDELAALVQAIESQPSPP